MGNFKTKLRGARNFIIGMLTMALIFTLVMTVTARSGNRTVTMTYNDIKVVIDGNPVTLTDLDGNAIEPVLIDNTLYVPMSPLVRALGKSSTYDGNAKTLYIGPKPAETVPFLKVAPAYDVSNTAMVWTANDVTMGGNKYNDAIVYSNIDTTYSLHNLNGKYKKITGYIGHVDGSNMSDATFNFYGDGNLIASYDVKAQDLPKQISLIVTGVKQFKIEVINQRGSGWVDYAFVGATIE